MFTGIFPRHKHCSWRQILVFILYCTAFFYFIWIFSSEFSFSRQFKLITYEYPIMRVTVFNFFAPDDREIVQSHFTEMRWADCIWGRAPRASWLYPPSHDRRAWRPGSYWHCYWTRTHPALPTPRERCGHLATKLMQTQHTLRGRRALSKHSPDAMVRLPTNFFIWSSVWCLWRACEAVNKIIAS